MITFSDESSTHRTINTALEVWEARALATLYVYLAWLVARQVWFTLMRRYETSIDLHVTSVVPLLYGRAQSQLLIADGNKSPDMNLQYVLSEYVDFKSQVPPISSYTGILIWVSERICRFWHMSLLYNTYGIYWSETSAYARNQENRFQTRILNV